jgi:hypothetical protein
MMQIVAVGMLDVETFGRDAFFVQVNPTEVMHYEVHRDGRIDPLDPEPHALDQVYSSVEKFNHGYLVEEPVPLRELTELPAYLGKFEITSPTRCRFRGW